MKVFNKHIIQSGESLADVAFCYGLDTDDLKYFHNNHCPSSDIILIDITCQKELFIPRTAVREENQLLKFGSGNWLKFMPENSFHQYGVIITIECGENKNEIKYETSVRWLRAENGFHFFEIDRTSKIFINEEEANDIADLLAYKVSQVLYPLQISVDGHGKFNAVENLGIFKHRWPAVKDEVYKEFEGEVVDEYLHKMEKAIDQPHVIQLMMRNDYFIRTLFSGIHQKYGKEFTVTELQSFPIVDNPVEPLYKTKLEVDPVKDEYGLVNIHANGILNEERSRQDLINSAPFPYLPGQENNINSEGNFNARYFMNGETNMPETIALECDIMLGAFKKVTVIISVFGNT